MTKKTTKPAEVETLEEAQEIISSKDAEIAALKSEIEANEEVIAELRAELASALAGGSSKTALPEVSHNGKKYRFAIPKFSYKGAKHAASEAAQNKALVAELIEGNTGVIVEITD